MAQELMIDFASYWTLGFGLFGILAMILLWAKYRTPRRLPPGPGLLRFMGLFAQSTAFPAEYIMLLEVEPECNLLQSAEHADPDVAVNGRPYYQNFKDIADEYGNGDLFCFHVGSYIALMICSLDAYRDIWNVAGEKITGRRHIGGCKFLNPKKLGVKYWSVRNTYLHVVQ